MKKTSYVMLCASYQLPLEPLRMNYADKTVNDAIDGNARGFGIGDHHTWFMRTERYTSSGKAYNHANAGNRLNSFAPTNAGQGVGGVAVGIVHQF